MDSATTGTVHLGDEPHPHARREAARHGRTTRDRARQVKRADFECFALLLAMDRQTERDLLAPAKTDEDRAKVRLFRRYERAPAVPTASAELDVPEPWYPSELGRFFTTCTAAPRGCWQH